MKKRSIISLALLAAGLAFIVIGAVRGEANAVMQKAIMICMEVYRPWIRRKTKRRTTPLLGRGYTFRPAGRC